MLVSTGVGGGEEAEKEKKWESTHPFPKASHLANYYGKEPPLGQPGAARMPVIVMGLLFPGSFVNAVSRIIKRRRKKKAQRRYPNAVSPPTKSPLFFSSLILV